MWYSFVDRDMYMRYAGGGVGHYHVPLKEDRTDVTLSENIGEIAPEPIETDQHYHAAGITGHGIDGDISINPDTLLQEIDNTAEGEDEGNTSETSAESEEGASDISGEEETDEPVRTLQDEAEQDDQADIYGDEGYAPL